MTVTDKKPISIYYRIFPTEKPDWQYVKLEGNKSNIYVRNLQELSRKRQLHGTTNFWQFATDGIFYNTPQEQMYESIMSGLPEKFCDGHTGIIISFGQTGMGKSFTTCGLRLTREEFGIGPRLIVDLMKIKESQPKNIKMSIELSCLEFVQNSVRDLLSDKETIDPNKKPVKEKIKDTYGGFKILYKTEGRKSMIKTASGNYSHIGTTVVTFLITIKYMDYSDPKKVSSRIHLIDTAGTDTVGNLASIFKTSHQIAGANLVKSSLEQFVLSLTENIPERIRIKQRLNPLLYYLGNDFSRENILIFIGHINTQKEDLPVTISMLRFGSFLSKMKPTLKKITFDLNEDVRLEYLEEKLAQLERERRLNSMLENRDLTANLTHDRIEHLKRLAQDFIKDKIREIDIICIADCTEMFKIFRELCKECEAERNRLNQDKVSVSDSSLKNRRSKGSQNSFSQGTKASSRRSSKKSESINIPAKHPSKLSQASIRSNASAKKIKKVPTTTNGSQKMKRKSRSNSLTFKHSSVTLENIPSKTTVPIPDVIPESREAWNGFINDPKSTYKKISNEYKQNEQEIQNIYKDYLDEVKNLYSEKETTNKRKMELVNAQILRKFDGKDEFDENGLLVTSYAEKICKENLDRAEMEYTKQQEKVLRVQADLKLSLEYRGEIKKRLCEDFDQYCVEKFEIVTGDLESVENDLARHTVDIELEDQDDDEIISIPKSDFAEELKCLKEIMQLEFEKRQRFLERKRRVWKE